MSDDTGRPNQNGLLGNCDCMTLWTQRAAQAAGLEHETLCAIMSEAQTLAEQHPDNDALVRDTMANRWPGVRFSIEYEGDAWVLLACWALDYPIPVAFSPTGWER